MNIAIENTALEENIRNKKLVAYCKRGIPPNFDPSVVCNTLFRQILDNPKTLSMQLGAVVELRGKRVLDIGSGSGFDSVDLSQEGAHVIALEYSQGRIEFNRELCKEKEVMHAIVRGDACRPPFKPDVFDIINCKHLIEHLQKPEERIAEMAGMLSPEGLIYINFPNRFAIRQIIADDHYQLPFIVLMPRPLAKFIVTRIFKYEKVYGTNVFLSKRRFEKMLKTAGLHFRYIYPDIGQLEQKLRNPGTINNKQARFLFTIMNKARLVSSAIKLLKTVMIQNLVFSNFTAIAFRVQPCCSKSII